jgi:Response regulator containing CheY-like receiver domain and AraC-type DNA-binding domain
MPIILSAIVVLGVCLRVCYTLFTDTGTRTYDVYRDRWGHLEYIKYIAQYTSLSVSEISDKIGFINSSYFYTLFKKVNGITPNEFRQNHHNNCIL